MFTNNEILNKFLWRFVDIAASYHCAKAESLSLKPTRVQNNNAIVLLVGMLARRRRRRHVMER